MDHRVFYANAIGAESGTGGWSAGGPGYRVDTPTDCPEPVQWMGRRMVGKNRMRLWSCERHRQATRRAAASGKWTPAVTRQLLNVVLRRNSADLTLLGGGSGTGIG